jgi:hypothetical protein
VRVAGVADPYGATRSPYGLSSPFLSQLPSYYSTKATPYASPLSSFAASAVSPFAASPPYSPSYRDSAADQTSADKGGASDERSDFELSELADKLYRELSVEDVIMKWGERARSVRTRYMQRNAPADHCIALP